MTEGLRPPIGGEVFFKEIASQFGFGGGLNGGLAAKIFSKLDFETWRKNAKTLYSGAVGSTLGSTALHYGGFCDGSADAYQVPAGKKLIIIGLYLNPLIESAGVNLQWGLGSATGAPSASWVTTAPTAFNGAQIGSFNVPASPTAYLSNLGTMKYMHMPFAAAISASRYPVATAQMSTANLRPGALIVHGLEVGA